MTKVHAKPPSEDKKNCKTHLSITSHYFFYLFLTLGNQFPHDKILAKEPLLPPLQALHLLITQTLERVQRAVKVLGQHFLVEAVAGEPAAGVAAGEILVGASGPVEVAAARHVEDAAPHRHVHRHPLGAVVGQQRARREGAEDDGWGLAR